MTRSIVMRMLAAASAVAVMTSLSAQSAPAQGFWLSRTQDPASAPKAAAPKVRGDAADRVQVRLAEVMAMLEEDEMSPELQQKALAKLAEVAKRLKEERVAETPRVSSVGGIKRPAPIRAPTPSPDAEPVFGRFVAPVPTDKPAQLEAIGVPMPPRPAKAPKAPKAPKPPKVPEAPSAVAGTVPGVIIDTEPEGAGRYRVYSENGQPTRIYVEQAEAAKKYADEARVQAQRFAEVREGAAESNDEVRVLLQRIGQQKAQAQEEVAKVRADATVARLQAKVARDEARADREVATRARSEAAVERAQDAIRAQVDPATPVRGRSLRTDPAADDGDIRATIDEMRAEMREIRQLMQEIRKRAQSEEQVETTTSSAFGSGFPSAGAFGSGSSAGSLPGGSPFGVGSATAATPEPTPASEPVEVRRVRRTSDNE